MFIRPLLQHLLFGAGLAAVSMASSAANITLVPSSDQLLKDESFSVDVVISDLQSATVASFEFEFDFEPTLMSWDGYSLNNYLGQPANRFDDAELIDANTVKVVASTGFFWPGQLSQPDSFVLATMQFTTTGIGAAEFSMSDVLVVDDTFNVNPIPIDPISAVGVQITEAAEPVQVPFPAATWWLTAVLVGWVGLRKIRV